MAIVPAGSPAFADVLAAYNACQNGDTLTIPASPATWGPNDFLNVTKAIQIIGAGMDQTQAIPRGTNATIITVTNTSGKFIQTTYPNTDFTCRISGLVLELTTVGSAYLFSLGGKAYRHRDKNNNIVGGLRLDHLRIRNTALTLTQSPLLFAWSGPAAGSGAGYYCTGSFDHNFIDYKTGSSSSEVNTFGCSGSPDGTIDGQGQYNWCQDYTYAGGDDTDFQNLYIEDNIFHKGGFCLGTLAGGARIVMRHNTAWGGLSAHGADSGGNMGLASWDRYNNHVIRHTTYNAAGMNNRGGSAVDTNNRFTNYGGPGDPPPMVLQISRPSDTNNGVFGNGSGKNFFDNNYKGTQVFNGVNFIPTATMADARIGDVYASGNGCTVITPAKTYTLNGLNGQVGQNAPANAWAGFCLINVSTAADPTLGEQGSQTAAQGLSYALILTSDTNASNCTVTLAGGANSPFNLTAGNQWEIRRVKNFFCVPGSGKIPFPMNGGNNKNNLPNNLVADPSGETTGAAFIPAKVGVPGQHKYWCNQFGFGWWLKNNLVRPDALTAWSAVPTPGGTSSSDPTGAQSANVAGGIHDGVLPPYRKNDGTGGQTYPLAPAQTASYLRIGADWEAPGIDPDTSLPYAEQINVGDAGALNGTTQPAYGGVYPNPMVATTVVTAPVINSLLTASSTIGSSFSYFITASNSPTSYGATQLPAGYAVNASTGEITCTAANNIGQPGNYSIIISATNTGGTDTQTLVLTLSGTASTQRGKGRAHRIGTAARRF